MDLWGLAQDLGLVTLVGSVVGLDRRVAFQSMISQPLVVVPLLGLILGDVPTGLWLGALLQLLWLSSLLVGASVPPNETMASVVIGGMVLLYGRHFSAPDPALYAMAILLGAPMSLAGRWMDVRLDRDNLALAARADEAARAGAPGVLSRLPPLGLLRAFAASAVLVGPALVVGVAALRLGRPAMSGALLRAFDAMGVYIIPALGLAVAASTVRRRRALVLAMISFVVMLFALDYEGTP